eukprot:TRINITY_DN2725_c0_g1_i1.p1 TRINITY_DN2725_c0_g1~~TRINITY_DN2725_c0_g1_i1.p1  ORF type:complete len:257 (-),score=88.33 TRINITY_DN2725_c0_g1_i1:311-1081(-)
MSNNKWNRNDILFLFDVDGTLAEAMKAATDEMIDYLKDLQTKVTVGFVGGSNLQKQEKQLGDLTKTIDFSFSENGLVAFKRGELIHKMELKKHLSQEDLNRLINYILRYIADLDIPIKRGTFIEFRTGMLNVSPIGRNCSYDERLIFNKYDTEHKIREKFVEDLRNEFPDLDLNFSIGGQISIDIFPNGWDKTYCLQHIREYNFKEIHFFGDKTYEGGNDYEIFIHDDVIGHSVTGPQHTVEIVNNLLSDDSNNDN